MTDRWLVEISGLKLGPLERAEIEQMVNSGEVRLDDPVCAEGSEDWLRASELFANEDDAFLSDDGFSPAGQAQQPAAAARRQPARDVQPATVSQAVVDDSRPESGYRDDDAAVASEPLEAQFYIQRDGDEVGPLALSVVQDFADDGLLHPDTPVRGEDDAEWTRAADYGFAFPESKPAASDADATSGDKGQRVYGGLLWLLFAPYFFLTSGGRSVSGMSRRQIVLAVTVILCVAYAGFHVTEQWSQTALTGVITLDGEPLPGVMIVLAGAYTGDSGTGVSDGSGRFRLVTIDGNLAPGEYQVTVRPLAASQGPDAPTIPERFQMLGRSDVTVEVTETTTSCNIELTTHHRLKRNRGLMGGSSSEASVE